MKYVTIKKINGIAGNHKIFLNEFPRVSFKQKLQTTEVFMHAHVDARHYLNFNQVLEVDVSKKYFQWISISYDAIKFEKML